VADFGKNDNLQVKKRIHLRILFFIKYLLLGRQEEYTGFKSSNPNGHQLVLVCRGYGVCSVS
jgi:hypothetical protein